MSPVGFGGLLAAYGGVLVLTVFLPFVASFILDGVVQLLRKNGPKFFLAAMAMTGLVALIGYVLWRYGSSISPEFESAVETMGTTTGRMLLTISSVLALLAFVSRTAKLLWKSRRANV